MRKILKQIEKGELQFSVQTILIILQFFAPYWKAKNCLILASKVRERNQKIFFVCVIGKLIRRVNHSKGKIQQNVKGKSYNFLDKSS